jgi:hypothetical protein
MGWATLVKDTAHDFVVFPRRKSTWTLLGVGAVAALNTHPADEGPGIALLFAALWSLGVLRER